MKTLRSLTPGLRAAALLLCFHAGLAAATPDAVAEQEIDHLLAFIAGSNCTFVRNGEAHPAPDASDHLAMKYRFTRGRINSAEDFVRYLATGSSTSGEPYKIICNKTEGPAGPWLAAELRRYRSTAEAPRTSR